MSWTPATARNHIPPDPTANSSSLSISMSRNRCTAGDSLGSPVHLLRVPFPTL